MCGWVPQVTAAQMQQIQREEKVKILLAPGPRIKADTKCEEEISGHPQQATERYTARENPRPMLHYKCRTDAKHVAPMSSQRHPGKVTV